jgi:hypothetical protein
MQALTLHLLWLRRMPIEPLWHLAGAISPCLSLAVYSVPDLGRVRLQSNRLGSIIAMRCEVSIALQASAAPPCRRQLYATIAIEP